MRTDLRDRPCHGYGVCLYNFKTTLKKLHQEAAHLPARFFSLT